MFELLKREMQSSLGFWILRTLRVISVDGCLRSKRKRRVRAINGYLLLRLWDDIKEASAWKKSDEHLCPAWTLEHMPLVPTSR